MNEYQPQVPLSSELCGEHGYLINFAFWKILFSTECCYIINAYQTARETIAIVVIVIRFLGNLRYLDYIIVQYLVLPLTITKITKIYLQNT